MPLAIRDVQRRCRKVPSGIAEEEAMATVGSREKSKAAVISFGGRWPLSFQLRMLTITGLLSSTPIPRRKP